MNYQNNSPHDFVDAYRKALKDLHLQKALSNATKNFLKNSNEILLSKEPDLPELRRKGQEIREHTINNLDYYLEEFTRNVARANVHIHWAENGHEANDYINRIARRYSAELIVKSKSMITEEIGLNESLQDLGVEVVETDLGEFIIQLGEERPSHILAPAIHKTREQIADLFNQKLKVHCNADPQSITAIARKVLSERFKQADMGITGVNFGVAETGSIVLVENEGNIRLTTSIPRIHIALMGIEKVIPRLDDLAILLKLLPLTASGQKASSYVSLLTGIKSLPSEEGPEQMHLVIIDNGRINMLSNPQLRESLNCIRCGACLNVCPVYQNIGGQAYGSIYSGPIGAVITPQITGRENNADLPFASSLCGACHDICPVKIDIPRMLLHLRHEINEGNSGNVANSEQSVLDIKNKASVPSASLKKDSKHRNFTAEKRLGKYLKAKLEYAVFRFLSAMMTDTRRYRRFSALARILQTILKILSFSQMKSLPIPYWRKSRTMPFLAKKTFREQWAEIDKNSKSGR